MKIPVNNLDQNPKQPGRKKEKEKQKIKKINK